MIKRSPSLPSFPSFFSRDIKINKIILGFILTIFHCVTFLHISISKELKKRITTTEKPWPVESGLQGTRKWKTVLKSTATQITEQNVQFPQTCFLLQNIYHLKFLLTKRPRVLFSDTYVSVFDLILYLICKRKTLVALDFIY